MAPILPELVVNPQILKKGNEEENGATNICSDPAVPRSLFYRYVPGSSALVLYFPRIMKLIWMWPTVDGDNMQRDSFSDYYFCRRASYNRAWSRFGLILNYLSDRQVIKMRRTDEMTHSLIYMTDCQTGVLFWGSLTLLVKCPLKVLYGLYIIRPSAVFKCDIYSLD